MTTRNQPCPERGAALVVTLIVMVVLAVVAVAFMQNTTLDRASARSVANHYRAKLAAEAGLAEAMALIQRGGGDLTYLSGAQPDESGYRTFIRSVNGSSGAWQFDGDRIYLDSGVGDDNGAPLLLTGALNDPGLTRRAAWREMPLENAGPNQSQRYAFWVDDASGKQNLAWWGGGGDRGVVASLADVPLVLPGEGGNGTRPFPPAVLNALSELRTYSDYNFELAGSTFNSRRADLSLPSVASLNLVEPDATEGAVERYFFTMNSSSGAAAPNGKAKLNFARLREHINSLNSNQGAGSPRAELVDDLLKEEPEGADDWGGGSLHWLAKAGKYSDAEQKQIVSNIIDYLDDDLVPTTDSVTSPSYFGVEYKVGADGDLRGHPVIAYLGFGLQFNISGPNNERPAGTINSTRILCALGLANPWPVEIEKAAYKVNLRVEMQGRVSGAPTDITEYFEPVFNDRTGGDQWDGASQIEANEMFLVAGLPNLNLRALRDFLQNGRGGGLQNVGATFSDVKYTAALCQLLHTPDDGGQEYVAGVVANLPAVDAQPATFTLPVPNNRITLTYATGEPNNELYLANDPRAAFLSDSFTASGTSYSGNLPVPDAAINIFRRAGDDADQPQGVPEAFQGLVASAMTNHISRVSDEGIESIGELGYIWSGKAWQTLNMLKVDSPANADWNLLDYVSGGSASGGAVRSVLPLRPAATTGQSTLANSLLSSGGFNVNTRKTATLTAVLTNAPGLSEDAAQAIADLPSGSQASAYGQIAAMLEESPELLEAGATTKFAKEAVQRALANMAVNHSRVFTVHAAGEYRVGDVVSRAQLEADVFVGVDPATGGAMIKVIDQRFR